MRMEHPCTVWGKSVQGQNRVRDSVSVALVEVGERRKEGNEDGGAGRSPVAMVRS